MITKRSGILKWRNSEGPEPALIAAAAALGNKLFNEMHSFVHVWTIGFYDLPENETVLSLR